MLYKKTPKDDCNVPQFHEKVITIGGKKGFVVRNVNAYGALPCTEPTASSHGDSTKTTNSLPIPEGYQVSFWLKLRYAISHCVNSFLLNQWFYGPKQLRISDRCWDRWTNCKRTKEAKNQRRKSEDSRWYKRHDNNKPTCYFAVKESFEWAWAVWLA